MPRLPVDYSKSIIYKICSRDKTITSSSDVSIRTYTYIASTTDEFVKRKSAHKSSCNNQKNRYHNLLLYAVIRENGGWENFEMIQIEEHPCHNKRELEFREEQIRREYACSM
jgi:hypothetical protein